MWIIFCKCGAWSPVGISIVSGGHCSKCGQSYNRKGQPVTLSDDNLSLDDFLSDLDDESLMGFIQSECCGSYGPEVN